MTKERNERNQIRWVGDMRLQVDIVAAVGTVHKWFQMAGLVVIVVEVAEVVECNTAGLRTDSVDTDSVDRLGDIEAAVKVKEVSGNREVRKKGMGSLAAW